VVGALSIDDYGFNLAYLSNFLKKTYQEATYFLLEGKMNGSNSACF
jgi:hypothetical protein